MLRGLNADRALVITKIPRKELSTVKTGMREFCEIEKGHIESSNENCKLKKN